MFNRIRPRLTYANVLATFAFFLALAGGAYAAFHLPKNSVKSKNIVDGQVRPPDLSTPYLAGTGRSVSDRIAVPDGAPAGTKIAVLPRLGRIEVFACNSNSGVFNAQYHNTSKQPEDLWQDTHFDSSGDSFVNEASVPPDGTLRLGGTSAWDQSRLNVGYGSGSKGKLGSVDVSSVSQGTSPLTCTFQVQGLVSP